MRNIVFLVPLLLLIGCGMILLVLGGCGKHCSGLEVGSFVQHKITKERFLIIRFDFPNQVRVMTDDLKEGYIQCSVIEPI